MRQFKNHLALIAVVAVTLASACSDSNTTDPNDGVTENTLVFKRADQSTIVFVPAAHLTVWCGPWESGLIPTQAIHVTFTGPNATDKGWDLRAVIADVHDNTPLTFPNNFIFDQPKGASLFINDQPNELSTTQLLSSGSITFEQLNCNGRVEFTVNATVASEFAGGPSVSVSGHLNAPVGPMPN